MIKNVCVNAILESMSTFGQVSILAYTGSCMHTHINRYRHSVVVKMNGPAQTSKQSSCCKGVASCGPLHTPDLPIVLSMHNVQQKHASLQLGNLSFAIIILTLKCRKHHPERSELNRC